MIIIDHRPSLINHQSSISITITTNQKANDITRISRRKATGNPDLASEPQSVARVYLREPREEPPSQSDRQSRSGPRGPRQTQKKAAQAAQTGALGDPRGPRHPRQTRELQKTLGPPGARKDHVAKEIA